MKKTTRKKSNSGEWLSVKNFKFPEYNDKASIVYSSFSSANILKQNSSNISQKSSSCSFSSTSKPNTSCCKLSTQSNISSFQGNIINLHSKLDARNYSFPSFPNSKKKVDTTDTKTFSVLTPKLSKKEIVITSSSIIKKPLHPNKFLQYCNSLKFDASNDGLLFSKLNSRAFYSKTSNMRFLDVKKIKLQAWIPQPMPSGSRKAIDLFDF